MGNGLFLKIFSVWVGLWAIPGWTFMQNPVWNILEAIKKPRGPTTVMVLKS